MEEQTEAEKGWAGYEKQSYTWTGFNTIDNMQRSQSLIFISHSQNSIGVSPKLGNN